VGVGVGTLEKVHFHSAPRNPKSAFQKSEIQKFKIRNPKIRIPKKAVAFVVDAYFVRQCATADARVARRARVDRHGKLQPNP
jgi:hypothetical protein